MKQPGRPQVRTALLLETFRALQRLGEANRAEFAVFHFRGVVAGSLTVAWQGRTRVGGVVSQGQRLRNKSGIGGRKKTARILLKEARKLIGV